jgi:hypothetical protein
MAREMRAVRSKEPSPARTLGTVLRDSGYESPRAARRRRARGAAASPPVLASPWPTRSSSRSARSARARSSVRNQPDVPLGLAAVLVQQLGALDVQEETLALPDWGRPPPSATGLAVQRTREKVSEGVPVRRKPRSGAVGGHAKQQGPPRRTRGVGIVAYESNGAELAIYEKTRRGPGVRSGKEPR